MTERGVILSVTSFPARIPHVAPALESILRQRGPDDRAILWLGEDLFPGGLGDVPEDVLRLSTARGGQLEIRFVKDVRSFTKLVPALKAFPDRSVVTLDDDVIYPDGVVDALKAEAKRKPGMVIAHCVSDLYRFRGKWRRTTGNVGFLFGSPFLRIVTGGGGALYPPGVLDDLVLDTDAALRMSPTADDIWFWFCATRKGTPVHCVPHGITRHRSVGRAATTGALSAVNETDDDRGNLVQLRTLLNFDPSVERKLLEVYGRSRLRILVSRLVRIFVRYPQQAAYCLRIGGWRSLRGELGRKLHHIRAQLTGASSSVG